MKKSVLIALAIALAPVPTTAAFAFLQSSVTYQLSGTINNNQYHSVTVNYDSNTITYHLNNDQQFTQAFVEIQWFNWFANHFAQRNLSEN